MNFHLSALLLLVSLAASVSCQCWKSAYGRGVGVPISTCPSGYQKDGALCYPACNSGFYGVGPVCWSYCSSDYQDRGAICWRDTHIYGKGCCCFFGHCCGNCNSGYRDDGCTCRRDVSSYVKGSYGRGAGIPLVCASNQEYDSGLCYSRCNAGFYGVGPVCWASCQGSAATSCGAFCATSSSQCSTKTQALIKGGINIAESAIKLYATPNPKALFDFVGTNIDLAIELMIDVCPAVPTQCWKNVADKSGSCSSSYSDGGAVCWKKCSGANSFDCGAFCTNSELNCAKMTLVFIKSGMDTLNSINTLKEKVTPKLMTFANAQAAKTFVTKLMGEAKNFQFSTC